MSADDRYASLKESLEDQVAFSEGRATLNRHAMTALTVIGLGCTVTAAVVGIFSLGTEKTVGGIAALPAVIAGIAQALKLEAVSSWHYRKGVMTRILLRRLRFEGPDPMTTEYISSISAAFNSMDQLMAEEWKQKISEQPPQHAATTSTKSA